MRSVLILMSTYNGEKYLKEQIDSILNQKKVEIKIFIRDDGSTDSTVAILNEYKKKYPDKFIIEVGENYGCRGSFFWLIRKAVENYKNIDYIAFADQDDIWLPEKLISGIKVLDSIDNKYKIYYCNYQMVDDKLNKIVTKPYKCRGTLEEAFILQPCLGCSMLISPTLLSKAAMAAPKECDIHDTWVYRLNLALGGIVKQDSNRYLLYRQHTMNVIGSNQSFLHRWKRRIKSFIDNKNIKSRQAKEIFRVYKAELPQESYKTIMMLATYKESLRQKFSLLSSKSFYSGKLLHNILFKIAIITNRI